MELIDVIGFLPFRAGKEALDSGLLSLVGTSLWRGRLRAKGDKITAMSRTHLIRLDHRAKKTIERASKTLVECAGQALHDSTNFMNQSLLDCEMVNITVAVSV